MIEAYPLCWPVGYKRNPKPLSSAFKVTADKAIKGLLNEINRLSGDAEPIISSNVPLRKDGRMYAGIADDELKDSGVAVYFNYNGKQRVLANDKWLTPAENIRALELTVNALRALPRWGASEILERTFSGFPALPEQSSFNQTSFWEILGLSAKPADVEIVHSAFKNKSKKVHPDIPGGSTTAFQELQEAYKQAFKTVLNFKPVIPMTATAEKLIKDLLWCKIKIIEWESRYYAYECSKMAEIRVKCDEQSGCYLQLSVDCKTVEEYQISLKAFDALSLGNPSATIPGVQTFGISQFIPNQQIQ